MPSGVVVNLSASKQDLLQEYTHLLQRCMGGECQAALLRACQLGRKAGANGNGVVKLAMHHQAMMTALMRTFAQEGGAVPAKAMGLLCAACPAWYGHREQKRKAIELHTFFAKSLSLVTKKQNWLLRANTALRRLNEMREQEARRIAHSLHGDAAQLLAAVHLAVEDVARDLEIPQRERLQGVRTLLDQIEDNLRRLSHELCPTILHDLGLVPALGMLADGVSRRAGVRITVEGATNGRLPILIETALYRIVQEALNNVAKHARATRVTIQLRKDDGMVSCSVRDDGTGFKVSSVLARRGDRGLGLIVIRERLEALGGTLSITSSPGRGTDLLASLPLKRGPRNRPRLRPPVSSQTKIAQRQTAQPAPRLRQPPRPDRAVAMLEPMNVV